MRLAEFIATHHEEILREWESFARTLEPAAVGLSESSLRDHAEEILDRVVEEMETRQSEGERGRGLAKATGKAQPGRLAAVGELHAALRIESGFTLVQVAAEYRALRASVFRLWTGESDPEGVRRFNEAIDEALMQAVEIYATRMNEYRDQLIGVVSHDLRNPLGGILMAAELLSRTGALDEVSARIAVKIERSAKRMTRIVEDLVDLTHTRFGSDIPMTRHPVNLGAICEMVIAELEGGRPQGTIRYTAVGNLDGEWDGDRIARVVSNLVGNALQHGEPSRPIDVDARGEGEEVALFVRNVGYIPEQVLARLFQPRAPRPRSDERARGLGLGLYIAEQLVTAHGGHIDVTSTEREGTTFVMRLPRHEAPLATNLPDAEEEPRRARPASRRRSRPRAG